MPLTKVDYSKTIIYKIQHREIDELLYVGSTTDFTRRKAQHKRACNNVNGRHYNMKIYKMIRDNGGFDCFNMTIIKEFPCENKRQVETEEDKIMRQTKANMNSYRAFATPEDLKKNLEQYRLEHKEQIVERKKQYYQLHKEQIAEYQKQYDKLHKEQKLERQKQYYKQNQPSLLEQQKQYYELSLNRKSHTQKNVKT